MSRPILQHRHYVLIARTIADMEIDSETRKIVAREFERALLGTNPNFDAQRFYCAAMGCPVNGRDA